MKIPKYIWKGKNKFAYEKQINESLYLYKNCKYGYKECFSLFDLGLVKQTIEILQTEKKRRIRY